jgi:hypothetical protein
MAVSFAIYYVGTLVVSVISLYLFSFHFTPLAIDLVVGGPPCSDFSKVNGTRKGVLGKQGQYLIAFGDLIKQIREHVGQKNQHLFFLVENVILSGNDLIQAREAYGITWDPVEFDAKYVSPCRRNRHFFMNVPLDLSNFDFQGPASEVNPNSSLEQGYQLAANIIESSDMNAKAQVFMASSGRINDGRMYVCKKVSPDLFDMRPINVTEREVMMGYPKGYVSKAGEKSIAYHVGVFWFAFYLTIR